MKSRVIGVLATVTVLAALPASAAAHHGTADTASNMSHLANLPKPGTTNSDLAFWGTTVYAGNYNGFRIIDASDPSQPRVLSDFPCRGPQSDVGVWEASGKRLLFTSVDRRQVDRVNPLEAESDCTSVDEQTRLIGFEGIRIFDVTNPQQPAFVRGVATDCGSHTHTVIPADVTDGRYRIDAASPDRVLIYVASYPLQEQGIHPDVGFEDGEDSGSSECVNPHQKISIVEVPFGNPNAAKVLKEQPLHVDTTPLAGGIQACHDIGVFLELGLAAAACLGEGQVWDISDPANPRTTDPAGHSHVRSAAPATFSIWHSGSFTWDGKKVLFGDEWGGGSGHGCDSPQDPRGNVALFGRSGVNAAFEGRYIIPRPQPPDEICTMHNYDFVPLYDRHVAVSSAYGGGTSVFDLTTPSAPSELGFFDPQGTDGNPEGESWSSYWYDGLVYANDIERGVDIFRTSGQAAPADAQQLGRLNPQTQERLLARELRADECQGAGRERCVQQLAGIPGRGTGDSRLVISRRTVRMARNGLVGVRVTCRSRGTCRGSLRLRTARRYRNSGGRLRTVLLASRKFAIGANSTRVLRVRFSARNRRLVRRNRTTGIQASARTRFVDGTGLSRASFRLLRPRRR